MAIDVHATKENMRMINQRAFLREMAQRHPEDKPVLPEVLNAILKGKYALHRQSAIQVIGYLREAGFLVELPEQDIHKAA